MHQIFGLGRYWNKLNLTKIKGAKMGITPNGPSKIKTY